MAKEVLKNLYFFRGISSSDLFKVHQISRTTTYNQGDVIFEQHQAARSLYVVKYGTIRVHQHSSLGEEIDVSVLGNGFPFGEMGFLDGALRSATAEAAEKSEVLEIAYNDLKSLLENSPTLAANFYRCLAVSLCSRLNLTTEDLSFAREKVRHVR